MAREFVKVQGLGLSVNGKPLVLRGFGAGNWLHLEHFMIGLPGTDCQIRTAIRDTYGAEKAREFWQRYQDSYLGEADFQFMKEIGTNVVRIPFNYRLFESDDAPYTYDENGFAQIDRILALCEKYGIYAILDLHAVPGGQNPDWHSDNYTGISLFWDYAEFRQRTVALWKYIARRYKDNPIIAAYDLLNEPCIYGPRPEPAAYQTMLAEEVRREDPNHVLFLEGDFYAHEFGDFAPSADPNVAYTFHYYPFFNLNNFPADEKGCEEIFLKETGILEVRERLKRPLWCGETGIPLNKDSTEAQLSLLKKFINFLDKHQVSWTLWCYKDARSMGVVHPTADSDWMKFSKQACGDWFFWGEFEWGGKTADQYAAQFGVEATERLQRQVMFRLMAINQLYLAERFRNVLKGIAAQDLVSYPKSFLFERCEVHPGLRELVEKSCLK